MKQSIIAILMMFLVVTSCKNDQKTDKVEVDSVVKKEESKIFTKEELTAIKRFPKAIKELKGISIFLDWDYNQMVLKSTKNADLDKTFFIYLFDKENQKKTQNFKWTDKKEFKGYYYLIKNIKTDFENLNKIHVRSWDPDSKLSIWDQYLIPEQSKYLTTLDLVEDEWNDKNYSLNYEEDQNILIIKAKKRANIDLPIYVNLFPLDPEDLPSEGLSKGYKVDKILLDKNYHYKDYYYYVYEMPTSFSVRKINIRQWNQRTKTTEWDQFIFLD